MNRLTRITQKAPYSLNQSMTNGLPALTPDNMNLCISQFYRRRTTQKYQDSPSNDSGRQYMFQKDMEQLKEEVMQLKKENQKLKHLNQQLCFQIKLDEKEQIEKKTTQEISDDQTPNTQNQRLLEKLKQARLLLQEKQIEIDSLKKSTRFMKIQEMENELCNTKLKFEILNKQFNEILKTDSEVNKFQKLTIQTVELEEKARQLANQHQKQKKKILSLRQELLTCQATKEKFRKQLENCQNEFDKYKKNHEQEIQKKTKYKDIIESLNHQLNEKQLVIQQMQNEVDKQRMLVSQKQKQYKDLEEQYQTKKSWLTNKREADTSFQEVLDDKVNKNQIVVTDDDVTNSQIQKSETKIIIEEEQPRERSFTQQNRLSMDSAREEQKSPLVQSTRLILDVDVAKQKLPKVNHCDVIAIAKQLKFQLMTQQVPLESIDAIFHTKQDITVLEVMEILTQFPFCIQQNKQALLLARYLVEDNTLAIVDFSLYQTNDSCIVKSVLKNVIGKYQLYDNNCQEQLIQQISTQIWKFRQSIIEQIKLLISKRNTSNELCDEDDFKLAIQNSNIILDHKQRDFLGFFIYKEFEGEKLFDYKTLIDKFNTQHPLSSPPKISIQQLS